MATTMVVAQIVAGRKGFSTQTEQSVSPPMKKSIIISRVGSARVRGAPAGGTPAVDGPAGDGPAGDGPAGKGAVLSDWSGMAAPL
ncbi:hypothetical protein Acid7E03_32790 [Acidisoma sp. 7E03]